MHKKCQSQVGALLLLPLRDSSFLGGSISTSASEVAVTSRRFPSLSLGSVGFRTLSLVEGRGQFTDERDSRLPAIVDSTQQLGFLDSEYHANVSGLCWDFSIPSDGRPAGSDPTISYSYHGPQHQALYRMHLSLPQLLPVPTSQAPQQHWDRRQMWGAPPFPNSDKTFLPPLHTLPDSFQTKAFDPTSPLAWSL